jgi:hypothetical protein
MLVKFLSFSATVIGTKRYKAILLSCIALFFSLAGISVAVLNRVNIPSEGGASSAIKDEDKDANNSDKLGIGQQKATEEQTQQQPEDQSQAATTPESTASPEPNTSTATAYDFTLSVSELTLPKNGTTVITATNNDGSKTPLTPTVVESDSNIPKALHITEIDNSDGLKFNLKVDKDAQPGKYKVIVTAKDAARNINVTKTITITVVNQS